MEKKFLILYLEFQSFCTPQQQMKQNVSGQVVHILKPRGDTSYHYVSSPPLLLVIWYLVMAQNMTQSVCKANQDADLDIFKPLPPFKVCGPLIFSSSFFSSAVLRECFESETKVQFFSGELHIDLISHSESENLSDVIVIASFIVKG